MKQNGLKALLLLLAFISVTTAIQAQSEMDATENEQLEVKIDDIINHHISDSHKWSIISFPKKDGSKLEIAIDLPVILIHKGSVLITLSSAFENDALVEKNGFYYAMYHDKIYVTDDTGEIQVNHAGEVTNVRPFDLSITKNVTSLFMSAALLLWLFVSVARKYRQRENPRGMQSAMEVAIQFIDKDIAEQQIGEKASRYTPYLLTLFFFIWINNLIGLIPLFPGSSNLSGNIAFTGILAVFTFLVTTFSGNRQYWRHILVVPGVPGLLKVILIPIEIISMFTKPFTLLIRLFANVTGGHIIMISLVSIIFIAKSYAMAPISISLSLLIFVLEIIFGLLQAYIFTLLSALYIGLATQEDNH